MPSVKVRVGEPIEKALRRLKKVVDKEGILKQFKKKRFYDKRSVREREKKKQARRFSK